MHNKSLGLLLFPLVMGLSVGLPAQATWQNNAPSLMAGSRSYNIEQVLDQLTYHTNLFQEEYDRALDRSKFDGTQREDNLNERVRSFRDSVRDLRNDYRDGDQGRGRQRIRDVIEQGDRLNNMLERSPREGLWRDQWRNVRQDLRELDRLVGGKSFY